MEPGPHGIEGPARPGDLRLVPRREHRLVPRLRRMATQRGAPVTRDGLRALIAVVLCCAAFWAFVGYAAVAWHAQIVSAVFG